MPVVGFGSAKAAQSESEHHYDHQVAGQPIDQQLADRGPGALLSPWVTINTLHCFSDQAQGLTACSAPDQQVTRTGDS